MFHEENIFKGSKFQRMSSTTTTIMKIRIFKVFIKFYVNVVLYFGMNGLGNHGALPSVTRKVKLYSMNNLFLVQLNKNNCIFIRV